MGNGSNLKTGLCFKMIEISKLLPVFFKILNTKDINYAILRGYEKLPDEISNDIDFGVHPNDFIKFTLFINNYFHKYEGVINIDLVRLDVVKYVINIKNLEPIKIDVWTSMNFCGLYYVDLMQALNNRVLYNDSIYIIPQNYEISISLLKELLHNSGVREDKKANIISKFSYFSIKQPLMKFFNEYCINQISNALFHKRITFVALSFYLKLNLLKTNISHFGLYKTLKNICLFITIKYFNQNYYKTIFSNI